MGPEGLGNEKEENSYFEQFSKEWDNARMTVLRHFDKWNDSDSDKTAQEATGSVSNDS